MVLETRGWAWDRRRRGRTWARQPALLLAAAIFLQRVMSRPTFTLGEFVVTGERGRLTAKFNGHGNGNDTSTLTMFSPEWEASFPSGKAGCIRGRKRYVWRPCGFGSNIIHLLNAWVYGLAVKKWSDLAIIVKDGRLDSLKCKGADGRNIQGYECLFQPMAHVCTFETMQEWTGFMRSHHVPEAVVKAAPKINWQYIRMKQNKVIAQAVEEYGVDSFGALAVMARILWNHMTPWLKADVRKETERPALDVFRESPYVGLHIRRGDKISEGEMKKVETADYLKAALGYLQGKDGVVRTPPSEIKAIWVASDDHNAVKEVRALAHEYFPNVKDEAIMWMSGGEGGGNVATRSELEAYGGYVFVFADLQLLSAADVFVGTFSSNVSRLVALLRESIDGKTRDSCISLDKKKFGVNYRRRLSAA